MSENGRNALQPLKILILGQLLNLVTNVMKAKIRLEKVPKSLITNVYGIIFDSTYVYKHIFTNYINDSECISSMGKQVPVISLSAVIRKLPTTFAVCVERGH